MRRITYEGLSTLGRLLGYAGVVAVHALREPVVCGCYVLVLLAELSQTLSRSRKASGGIPPIEQGEHSPRP
jgi:hypothetical protein